MKQRYKLVFVASCACASLFAGVQVFAQGITRQQVSSELAQYVAAGFNPAHENPATWVADAQAASARVASARPSDGAAVAPELSMSH